jgi:hypothetical protein
MIRMLTCFHSADPAEQVRNLEWRQRLLSADLRPAADTPEEIAAKLAAMGR